MFRTRRRCRPKSCQHPLMDCLCGAGQRRIHRRIFSHRCCYEHGDGIFLTLDVSVSDCENRWAPWQGLTWLNASMPLCCDTGNGASGLEGSLEPHMDLTIVIILYAPTNPTQTRASSRPRQSRRPNRP